MAALPPRSSAASQKTPRQSLTSLQVLLQMGFPKRRAEKALLATGDRGVQIAADWLLSHVNDPTLDDSIAREYIVYLCPTGILYEYLMNFWKTTLAEYGFSNIHNYLPHVTLGYLIKCEDEKVELMILTLRSIIEKYQAKLGSRLKLEWSNSQTFIGFFIEKSQGELLKSLINEFSHEMSSLGVIVNPQKKNLHLTLAYKFSCDQYLPMLNMIKKIDLNIPCDWEIRLYSRDPRIEERQTYLVLHNYQPSVDDELELSSGDYLFINMSDCSAGDDNWVPAISWQTGCEGLVPTNFIKRAAESNTWTLHRSFRLLLESQEDFGETGTIPKTSSLTPRPSEDLITTEDFPDNTNIQHCEITKRPWRESSQHLRWLIVIRHGERVDFTFGGSKWIAECFDSAGRYFRKDINMPKVIPKRIGGPQDFMRDCPLTEIGLYQAKLTGEAMKDADISLSHVYCSPAFRCLQTCNMILEALDQLHLKIQIEPGLFEWMAWYWDIRPKWMTPKEVHGFGLNVNIDYVPIIKQEEIHHTESCEDYYLRSHFITQEVLSRHKDEGGNILFVGHAATLDTCTRQLSGGNIRNANDISKVCHKIPYCGSIVCEESASSVWNLIQPPFPTLLHSGNQRFDWKSIQLI